MIVSISSNFSCQLRSPYSVGYTSTIRFNQARLTRTGVVCPNNSITFLDMSATICLGPGLPVSNSVRETRFGLMANGGHFIICRSVGALGDFYSV